VLGQPWCVTFSYLMGQEYSLGKAARIGEFQDLHDTGITSASSLEISGTPSNTARKIVHVRKPGPARPGAI
jgi:hypothetical protein